MKSKDECALLTHTGMKLDEIARDTGFEYDTCSIKQFQADKLAVRDLFIVSLLFLYRYS